MVVNSFVASSVQRWYSIDSSWTCELAHSNSPPSGAKMTPTAKNSGRTVLGVRMGCQAFRRCCRKAVSMLSWSMAVRALESAAVSGSTYLVVSCSFPFCHPALSGPPANAPNPCPSLFATDELRMMQRQQ
jgi:hypothetical protein